ncbi:MAG: GAF domain-containing sensor histidine kinase [Chloroflexi bacterium]|nr:GAF domain-containing sensor histidine kinase [Chloroflexota bacterium]
MVDLGDRLVPRWASDSNKDFSEITESISRLTVGYPAEDNFTSALSSTLEAVGQFTRAQRVTLTLQTSAGPQEISWTNKHASEPAGGRIFHARLMKSGPNNHMHFYFSDLEDQGESLYVLIATLIDSQLALGQVLQAEHSQRLLAESINQISKILTSTLNRDEVLSLFLDQLETLVPYDSASVMLLQDGLLYMHAVRGYENYSGPINISKVSFFPHQTYLMNEVLTGTQPVILHDARKSPEWRWTPFGEHIRSWMGVPLRVKGNAIGLFSIDKNTPDFYTDKHSQLASALAKHAALALDNASLFADLQEAHKRLQSLSDKIIGAQEKERQKIAMELHDQSGQALLALRAELQVLRYNLLQNPKKAQDQISYLDQIVVDLNTDLERLAYDLRPPALNALGLVSALEQYITDFSRRMKIRTDFASDTGNLRLPAEIELVCYRIVQEALTNVAKHAHADHVDITINYFEDVLYLVVKDNGSGIQDRKGRRGFGLLGIRERLAQIQGLLEIHSQPSEGTEMVVTIPVPKTSMAS